MNNLEAPLLLINPNTSEGVTRLLLAHAQAAAGALPVRAVTARFGAPYIACEASYAMAGHAVLDAWVAALRQAGSAAAAPRAVLIGCFGDPGLQALRESSPVPVTGLAEGAFATAAALGRFAVVTGGEKWQPILTRLAHALGYGEALAAIHTVAPTGAQLADDPAAAHALLAQACREAAADPSVRSVIVGGAGLAGLAAKLQPHVPLPLIDSVQAGTQHALALALAAPAPHQKNAIVLTSMLSRLAAWGAVLGSSKAL
jgi:allantoin racemase